MDVEGVSKAFKRPSGSLLCYIKCMSYVVLQKSIQTSRRFNLKQIFVGMSTSIADHPISLQVGSEIHQAQ